MPYVGGSLTTFFNEMAQQLTSAAARAMATQGGERIKELTKMNTPVETGQLRESWQRSPAAPYAAEGHSAWRTTVSTDVEYAPYVEYGTGLWGPKHAPYIIKPKNPGGYLRFLGKDGHVVFAKEVLHPGSPGNHMLAIGMNVTHGELESGVLFRDTLAAWVRGVEGLAHG